MTTMARARTLLHGCRGLRTRAIAHCFATHKQEVGCAVAGTQIGTHFRCPFHGRLSLPCHSADPCLWILFLVQWLWLNFQQRVRVACLVWLWECLEFAIHWLDCVTECSCYNQFKVFVMKGCSMLGDIFFASIEIIIRFLFLVLFTWCVPFIDVWKLSYPSIPGISTTWSGWMSRVLLDLICWHFVEHFYILCSSGVLVYSSFALALGFRWRWPHCHSLGLLPFWFE